MDPLSKVWLKLENAKKSDAPPLSLEEFLSLLEQTLFYLVKQIIRFRTIEDTTFYRAYALLRRQKTY